MATVREHLLDAEVTLVEGHEDGGVRLYFAQRDGRSAWVRFFAQSFNGRSDSGLPPHRPVLGFEYPFEAVSAVIDTGE